MKLELKKDKILIIPETIQDEMYLKQVAGVGDYNNAKPAVKVITTGGGSDQLEIAKELLPKALQQS